MLRSIQLIQSVDQKIPNVDAYIIPLAYAISEFKTNHQTGHFYVIIDHLFIKDEMKQMDLIDCKTIKGFFIKNVNQKILNKMNLKLREMEANQKCAFGELSIIASIDSVESIGYVGKIASYARVDALYVDLLQIMKEITLGKHAMFSHIHYLKEKIVLDTAKHQKSIIDAHALDFNQETLSYLRRIGFTGVEIINQEEVMKANQIFTPSIEEINYAKKVLDTEFESLMAGKKIIIFDEKRLSEHMIKKSRKLLQDASVLNLFQGIIPPIVKRKKVQKEKPAPTKFYSLGEEIANAISHGAGAILGVVALVIFIVRGIRVIDEPRYLISGIVFGLSILLLYLMSTLYHSLPLKRSAKQVFRRFDHASIYILIAGSYTPFILLLLDGTVGLYVALIMWFLAITGIILKVIWIKKFSKIHLALYIALGWLPVMFFIGEVGRLGIVGLSLLIAGGVSYTVGVVFYALKLFKFTHMVWHLFCIVGTLLHFLTVLLYL